jgi:ATP-binding cassette subfamily C protein
VLNDLKKLFSIFDNREKVNFLLQIVLMIFSSLLEIVGIGAIPLFLVFVSSPEKLKSFPLVYDFIQHAGLSGSQLLWIGTFILAAFFLIKNGFLLFVNYVNARFLFQYKLKLEKKLFTAYLHAPYVFHLSVNTSKLIANLNSEIRVVILNVLMPLFKLINFGVLSCCIVFLLILAEPLISMMMLLVLGTTVGLFLNRIKKRIRQFGQEDQEQRAIMVKWINQSFGGLKDIRILNRESYFQAKFYESIGKTARSSLYNQVISNVPKPLVETASVFAMLGIIVYLVSNGYTVESMVSLLVLFGAAFIRLMPAVQSLASNYSFLKYSTHAIHPIYEDLTKLGQFEGDKVSVKKPLRFENTIQIQEVNFSYPETSKDVLQDITLEIKPGDSVAFVGPSGSGKTTLVDIIMGLLSPTNGKILVDGLDIRDHAPAWFQNIGYVPQAIYLMDDTIRRNIAMGLEDVEIDENRVQEVLEEAQLTDFVRDLPEGLSTSIGERGVKLSGGQRQRIGIARALYHDPQVLVLDEATSALDNITEKYIIDAIERFKGKRTIIMIAHRLSTVKKCDILYYMSHGKILSKGSFDELVEREEEFRRIVHS